MSDHFACIGLVGARDERFAVMERAFATTADALILRGPRSEHRLVADASGAAMAVSLERGAVACVTPFFAPERPTRWQVRTSPPIVDAECIHCSGVDCDVLDATGEMVTRAAVQLAVFAPYAAWLRERRTFEMDVVAFAHSEVLRDGGGVR